MVPLNNRSSPPQSAQEKPDSDECGIYLATVDLGRLGRTVKNGVKSGRIKNVYVLGYVPDSSAEETDEE